MIWIFDFDSTFVRCESFDELAKQCLSDQGDHALIEKIASITMLSMEGRLAFHEALAQRVASLPLTREQITRFEGWLVSQVSASFKRQAAWIRANADKIYILSGGFKEFILPIVTRYGISPSHVYANTFTFDYEGRVIGYDTTNPLAGIGGKTAVIRSLGLSEPAIMIGDGYNDLVPKLEGVVSAFYLYTENVHREVLSAKADKIVKRLEEIIEPSASHKTSAPPRALLLENIHEDSMQLLQEAGFEVTSLAKAMTEDELCDAVKTYDLIGIRSKTQLTKRVLEQATQLKAIGAFCIGTNQIESHQALLQGIPVFNAPYSNTRSVVELSLGLIIILMRKVYQKARKLHQGEWDKSAEGSMEVRGKTLGIVGYGNIGSQLSILAEGLGMHVIYYDIKDKLPLGNAKPMPSLKALLEISDVVSLHVDGDKANKNLIDRAAFAHMKDKAIFLNLSRGSVVCLTSLYEALASEKLRGAAIDVFPYEPLKNDESFVINLQELDNVILTPHIGGSTQEAQRNIAHFVTGRLQGYFKEGSLQSSVNFPNVMAPRCAHKQRIVHIHKNVPGMLAHINQLFANESINVVGQYLSTNESIGVVISDLEQLISPSLCTALEQIAHTIKVRVLEV